MENGRAYVLKRLLTHSLIASSAHSFGEPFATLRLNDPIPLEQTFRSLVHLFIASSITTNTKRFLCSPPFVRFGEIDKILWRSEPLQMQQRFDRSWLGRNKRRH
ncbi:MAG: hypothetical protein P4L81_02580, partial [Candidatus Pacebacteria bacterium]|nr:hypothetical protein [Candidatus Paceibacterota bacterium]